VPLHMVECGVDHRQGTTMSTTGVRLPRRCLELAKIPHEKRWNATAQETLIARRLGVNYIGRV
jgi:hypothetical protein